MPKEEIIALIEAAFADTPSPGVGFGDISATQWDEGIVEYFGGRTWRGHRVQDLRKHSAALSFFTDKAYRYWLPAFMIAEIEDPIEADIIGESIAFDFTKSESAESRLWQFTPEELRAILAFFDECAQRYTDGIYDVIYHKAANTVRARMEMQNKS